MFYCLAEEKTNRAFCVAIAALVGDGIYNFGELVSIILFCYNNFL